jgi:serine/threonine-protein kinase
MEQLGKYEILGRVGEGGFGTVWKGRDPFLKRTVAIKTCTSENEELRRRFLREAEIAGGLHHPNVVVVHDFGFHDEVPYLVQEFLSGEDLSAIVKRHDAVPLATKLRWLADVARGLEYAHSRGVVHRDVKPSNVRVLDDGTAKVMDFGIAKLAEMNSQQLTRTGTAMGTVGYMAPEQVNGQPVDHRADVFAFGVLAYELLTYERPFEAETLSRAFYRILHEDPRPLTALVPGVPPDLERIVLRCLAKDPHHRYGSCREVLADLERVAAGRPLAERDEGEPTAIAHPGARRTEATEAPPTVRFATAPSGDGSPSPPSGAAAPASAATYAAPTVRRLPRTLAVAAGLGALLVGATVLLVVGRESEPTTVFVTRPASPPAHAAPARTQNVAETPPPPREERPEPTVEVGSGAVAGSEEAHLERAPDEERAEVAPRSASPEPVAAQAPPAPRPTQPEPKPAALAPAPATGPSAPPASAPAPATAPATVAAPAPAAAAPGLDDEAGVRRALEAYRTAYEALDAGAVARVWTGLGEERAAQLAQAFANYRWLKLELAGCVVRVAGERATADCRLRQSFELKVGRGTPRDAAVTFRLRRSGADWLIEEIGG